MVNNNDKYKNHSREELIDELETLKKKKYGLVWDKKNSQEMLDAFVNWEDVPENFTSKQFPVLKEVKNKEIELDKDKPVNLLIEGDNYHSLAVLNFTHQNKVDVIYIDPPYNTGNKDFIFNDKFVDKDDPWRHSKWLSFMEKRLKLAKNLLSRNGSIFISIDDNEQAQLKLLCDEIFGSENFVGEFIWQKQGNDNKSIFSGTNTFRNDHEFITVYAKNARSIKFNRPEEKVTFQNDYGNADNDPRGNWMSAELGKSDKRSLPHGKNYFTLKSPTGVGWTRQWHYSETEIQELIKENKIYFGQDGDSVPRLKKFLSDKVQKVPSSLLLKQGSTKIGIEEITNMFGGQRPFDYPKPVELIKYILQLHPNKSAIILDFFAGSGTTGHAVLELNKNDKGNRRFILGTNNENGICAEVCYPRIKKAVGGYKNTSGKNVSGLGGNLKYFQTDFVGSDSTDKNKRDLVNKSAEMICIKEDIFDLVADGGFNYRIYQKGKKFLGVVFDIDAIADFKKEAEKYKGSFVVYCFSYTEATPEKEFKGLKNKYVLKPIPAIILRIYLEIFKK